MFGYKVYINYLLWRIGLRDALPAAIVNSKHVRECNEPLENYSGWQLRRGVIARLKQAEKSLPDGISIKILSAFRPLSEQRKLWDEKIAEIAAKNPGASNGELKAMARAMVANPENGGGGHQTGGAVDLTLCDAHGRELDMGGVYLAFDSATPMRAVKNKNREMLCRAMTRAGFANYPREWWHYSFGDKMWAAYKREKFAIYGAL
jgi:D-alanyl-D-alanine dipeptidase